MTDTKSLREAATMALEALTDSVDNVRNEYTEAESMYRNYPTRHGKVSLLKTSVDKHEAAIDALCAALALPDAEPVAIIAVTPNGGATIGWMPGYIAKHNDKLYAAPQPATVERKPLTDRQAYDCIAATVGQPEPFEEIASDGQEWAEFMGMVRAIEAMHGIQGAA